ncbi:MAG: hypothetical protein OSA36_09170 [Acidimicrobiales bacterium]|nr:hypothetical protein [Acidimicrobiales bacterium]
MHMRTLAPTALVILALAASGCGLLETNDDELETLRVEIIQLRENFMDLEAEVSLLARVPATTVATSSAAATTAAPATTTTRATSSGASSADGAEDTPAATVPVGLNEDAILTATYSWGPSDPAMILQEMLGIAADGWYGNGTRSAHVAELEARGLDTAGVPSPPTTTAAPEEATTAEAPVETTTTAAATEATTTTAAATEATTTTAAATETTTTTTAPAETTTTAAG